jgi:hypothetical protein
MADAFVFRNGKTARTADDLLTTIEQDAAIFADHVNKDRNDFATWLEAQLKEKALADQLRTTTDRVATIAILRKAIRPTPVEKASKFLETGHQKEFLFGLMMGVILGMILFRILQVIA